MYHIFKSLQNKVKLFISQAWWFSPLHRRCTIEYKHSCQYSFEYLSTCARVRGKVLLLWNSRVRVKYEYQKFRTRVLRVQVPSTSTPALIMIISGVRSSCDTIVVVYIMSVINISIFISVIISITSVTIGIILALFILLVVLCFSFHCCCFHCCFCCCWELSVVVVVYVHGSVSDFGISRPFDVGRSTFYIFAQQLGNFFPGALKKWGLYRGT